MYIVIIALKSILSYNKINLAICIFCGIIVYGIALYATGEAKNEVKLIFNKLKKN